MASIKKSGNFVRVRRLTAVLFVCLLLSIIAAGRTLGEYREALRSASAAAQALVYYADETAADESRRDAEYEREVLAEIRAAVPATEKIEWEGAPLETGNEWLEATLKSFEEETDPTKRRVTASEISERLAAIEDKINELTGAAQSARSKDEDKRKLAEILRRAEYQKPEEQQESWFARVQKKIRDWFNEKLPQPNLPAGAGEGMKSVSVGLQILLYALVLGFIAFVIYRFAPFFARRFRRGEREEKGERVILGEKLAADETAQTLFDEAESLARAGNLRGAIRKGYIALLCELSDRRVIGLAQHKTNRDYLRDVRRQDALYQNMNGLTASFERHWYGFETADEAAWQEFKQNYQQAVKSEQ